MTQWMSRPSNASCKVSLVPLVNMLNYKIYEQNPSRHPTPNSSLADAKKDHCNVLSLLAHTVVCAHQILAGKAGLIFLSALTRCVWREHGLKVLGS